MLSLSGCGGGRSSPVANAGGPYSGQVGQAVTFNGTASKAPSGQTLIAYIWSFGDGSSGAGVNPTHIYAKAGTYQVSLVVADAGQDTGTATATANIAAQPGPNISSFSPASGPIGTVVTVSGTDLTQYQGTAPEVFLSQVGGGSLPAPLSNFAANAISFVIPPGAATGKIEVSIGTENATSSSDLTVTPSASFTVGVAPSPTNLIQGQSVALAVTLNSTSGFNGLANLAVTGLPAGITGSFVPGAIGLGQTAVFTLNAPSSQATGGGTFTVSATAMIDGQPVTQTAVGSVNVTGITTSFYGRTVVDDATETPISGVTISFAGQDGAGRSTGCSGTVISDPGGNFAFTALPTACTGPQLIAYNGATATSPAGKYAGVTLKYTLAANQVTTSPVLVHLPRIDNAETVQVQQNAPADQVFYFHSIPGLKVTVYKGTALSLDDGSKPNPFPLVAIEIPIDRLPDAIPTSGMLTPFIVAFQPANATASQPVSVDFPNTLNTPPGTAATFVTLDPTRGVMVPYGTGMVSSDGARFVANADPANPGHGYGLVHFDWHGPATLPQPGISLGPDGGGAGPSCPVQHGNQQGGSGAAASPTPGLCLVGAPIDVSSGLVTYVTTDLSVYGNRGPLSISRIYRTVSANPGPFGLGTGHNYSYALDLSAYVRGQGLINLVTPDGSQFPLALAVNVPLAANITLLNGTIPALRGAGLTSAGPSGPYYLRWLDGTIYQFTVFTNLGSLEAFLTSVTDLNGNTTTITLNPNQPQQIQSITDPVGRKLTFICDSSNRITKITDPIGRSASYTYNAQGTLATFTDANGGVTQYAYDASNNLASITDPRGIVTEQNTYNTVFDNRILRQVGADGGTFQFAYTLLNPGVASSPVLQTVVTDPLGYQTVYRFDPQQFLISATDPSGQTRTLTRDPAHNNLVSSYTGAGVCPVCGDPRAGDVSFTFDQFGNLLTRTDALGNTTTFAYDTRFNRVNSITNALNQTTSISYDSNGNPISLTDANGNATALAFDSFGELTQITDPAGSKTAATYDGYGNLASITDAQGHTSTFGYDAISRLIRFTDALGRISSASYDPLDRVISQTDPRGATTSYTYDAIGDLLAFKDARGNSTQFTYDSFGRLQSRVSPLGKSESYKWDADSNLVQYTDRRGLASTYSFDNLNRLVQETYTDATVTRSYDANSRLVTVTDSQGGLFAFAWDGAGRLLTQDEPTGIVEYTRDALGRVATRQVVGQDAVQYTRDPVGNMLSAATSAVGVTYKYDVRNLPQSLTRTNGVVTNYTFDSLYQVLSIVHSSGSTAINTINYAYDAVGNRSTIANDISQPLITQSATATVDNANELLTSAGTTYTHDANGNRLTAFTSSGTITYTWDGRNRLSSINDTSGGTTRMKYDFGRDLLNISNTSGATTMTQGLVLDGLTNIVSVMNSGSPALILTGGHIDSYLASINSTEATAFGIEDVLGSTTALTDASGFIAVKHYYDPFGQSSSDFQDTYPFGFTGRSPRVGDILYFRSRFYDTDTGRFLSEDPLGILGGVNFYTYVKNNPISYLDPMGLCKNPWLDFGFFAGSFIPERLGGVWLKWAGWGGWAYGAGNDYNDLFNSPGDNPKADMAAGGNLYLDMLAGMSCILPFSPAEARVLR